MTALEQAIKEICDVFPGTYERLMGIAALAKAEERARIRVKAEWCGKSEELGNMVMVPASMLNPDKPKEAGNGNS